MDEDVVLLQAVDEGDGSVDPLEDADGGDEPGGRGSEGHAVELDAADDDGDAEPEGSEEEGLLWVHEGLQEALGV